MSSGYPCKVVFSDTVGFIRKLPHQLVESFKSTLEEVNLADLLLHLVDCSDRHFYEQVEQTRTVLAEIGADSIPYIMIYNKIDAFPDFVPPIEDGTRLFVISATERIGISPLRAEIVSASDSCLCRTN